MNINKNSSKNLSNLNSAICKMTFISQPMCLNLVQYLKINEIQHATNMRRKKYFIILIDA